MSGNSRTSRPQLSLEIREADAGGDRCPEPVFALCPDDLVDQPESEALACQHGKTLPVFFLVMLAQSIIIGWLVLPRSDWVISNGVLAILSLLLMPLVFG